MCLDVYNTFFDRIHEMLSEEGCEPNAQKDEWYITFLVKNDDHFEVINRQINDIGLKIFDSSDRRRRVRIRRCNQKCTVNFIC